MRFQVFGLFEVALNKDGTPEDSKWASPLQDAPARTNSGRSAESLNVARTPSGPATWTTVASSENSRMRWRQPPQGVQSASPSPTTQISAIRRPPAAAMAAMALVSAHQPFGIGRVLDVAAGVDRPVRRAERRPDAELRIRRVGQRLRGLGGGEQVREGVSVP